MTQSLINNIGADWAKLFQDFLESDEFKEIGKVLKTEQLYPDSKEVFKPFRTCPYKSLHTVVVSSSTGSEQLDNKIYSLYGCAISEDLFNGQEIAFDIDYLSRQGILFINCDLSYGVNFNNMYYIKVWRPFINYVINYLNENNNLTFVLLGKEAQTYFDRLDGDKHDCYKIEHPYTAIVNKRKWKHDSIFERIDSLTTFLSNKKINWRNLKSSDVIKFKTIQNGY